MYQTLTEADVITQHRRKPLKPLDPDVPVFDMGAVVVKFAHRDQGHNHRINGRILGALGVQTVATRVFPVAKTTFETLCHADQRYGMARYQDVHQAPCLIVMEKATGQNYREHVRRLDKDTKDALTRNVVPQLLACGVLAAFSDLNYTNVLIKHQDATVIDYDTGLSCKGPFDVQPASVPAIYNDYMMSSYQFPQFQTAFDKDQLAAISAQALKNYRDVTRCDAYRDIRPYCGVIQKRHGDFMRVLGLTSVPA